MDRSLVRTYEPVRWVSIALLIGLLAPLFTNTPLLARPGVEPATPGPRPAQTPMQLYLPLVTLPDDPAPVGAPTIESFQIRAASGPMAAAVALQWQVQDATEVRIEPGIGPVGGNSVAVYPVATTTYTLTARNAQGSVSAATTYTVDALPTPNPLNVSANPDTARQVSAAIGPAGGVLEATGADGARYRLTVPPEALVHTEVITLTPVATISGMPFSADDVRAVSIAPEGLLFVEPATLTITPAEPANTARTVGFAFQEQGAEFHLRTLQTASEAELNQAGTGNRMSVSTARSYGSADVAGDEILTPLTPQAPSDPADAAEHAYNTALDQAMNATIRRMLLVENLRDSFTLATEAQLTHASSNPEGPAPFDLESAVRAYINWRARVRAAGMDDLLRPEISRANLLLGEALRKAGELSTTRCNQGRPAQGFALQRYMSYAKRFGLVNTHNALEDRLAKCWVFNLTFQSRMDVVVEEVSGLYELGATVRLAYRPGEHIVGSAPLTWQDFDVTLEPDCTMTEAHQDSTLNADGDALGLWIEPVSRSSPNVSFRFSYEIGQPLANWTVSCPEQPSLPFTSPFWWVMYGGTHSTERQGDMFTARASGVNPNTFPGWIYDVSLNGVVEHTEIALKHTPE